VCLLAPLAGLLVAEVAVRVLGIHALPLPKMRGSVVQACEDPMLLFENVPHGRQVLRYRSYSGAARTIVMQTNGQRFRGPDVDLDKPPGILRVVCLGDSHTFGAGVSEGDTWPARLGELSGPGVEVMNCGVNGYDTLQEVLWYERRVALFDPDVVILAFFVNDVVARGLPSSETSDRRVKRMPSKQPAWIAACRARSRAFDVLCVSLKHRRMLENRASFYSRRDVEAHYVPSDAGWQRARDAIVRIQEDCRLAGRRFYVVLMPFVVRDEDGQFLSRRSLSVVAEYCENAGVECFDGEPSIQELDDGQLCISPFDSHASARVYESFATGLAEWLRLRGLPFSAH